MSPDKDKIVISNETREFIVNTLVEPYYKDMVKTTITGKKWWRNLGISFETASKVMVALGGIFSFSAGYYHDDTLSFVSGSISCMSLALLQIASFSYKENKKQGDELNILLKKLKLDTVPSMPRSEDQSQMYLGRESAFRTQDRGRGSFTRHPSFTSPTRLHRSEVPYEANPHVSFADTLEQESENNDTCNIPIKELLLLQEYIREQEEKIIAMTKELVDCKNDIEIETYMV